MQLSTRGRYAVMALLDLAKIQKERGFSAPVKLGEIAERQSISLSYLEQLFAQLRREGVVKSVRGPGGGYTLYKDAHATWIHEIVLAVNEPIQVTRCGGKGNCMKGGTQCNSHHLWAGLADCIEHYLSGVSLGMVLENDIPLTSARA